MMFSSSLRKGDNIKYQKKRKQEDIALKRIYITSLHLQHGGVQFIVAQSANAFAERGYEVMILCTYDLGEPAFHIDEKVKIKYLTDYKPNREEFKDALKSLRPIRVLKEGMKSLKILRAKKKVLIDAFSRISDGIIISTRNEDSVLLAKYGQNHVLKIAQIHHDVIPGDKVSKDIRDRYVGIDVLAVLTKEVESEMREHILPKDTRIQCVTIENFITPLDLEEDSVREKTILSVGRLHKDKGYDRLLKIFSRIHAKYPDWKLQIIGDGLLRHELEQLVKEYGMESTVEFTGFLDNKKMRIQMQKASIYAMTSIHEGFGIVLVEAMDSGLPVISFDVRVGPRSIITDGVNGFLVRDNDYEGYLERLSELIEDEALRGSISANARERARDFYKSRIIDKWIEIFEATN